MEKIYLKPAKLYIGRGPVLVSTVLGSCVSVTLFHRKSGFAGICHAVQPACGRTARCPSECADQYRYADCVVNIMAHRFANYGIALGEVEVKLFGGALILGRLNTPACGFVPVGRQNVQAAMRAIVASGLSLKIADVGGECGRKIIFETGTGQVLLKRLGLLGKTVKSTQTVKAVGRQR